MGIFGNNRIQVIEIEANRGRDYYPYIQIIGKPNPDEKAKITHDRWKGPEVVENNPVTELESFTGSTFERLKTKAMRAFKKYDGVKAVFEKVSMMQPLLWTPRNMHGAEYERGGFENYITHMAIDGGLTAAEINVDVNTDMKFSGSTQKYFEDDKKDTTFRDSWKQSSGIEVEKTIPTTVYIIAPSKNMAFAKDFTAEMAAQEQEMESHRGIEFNQAVAIQSLSDDDKVKLDKQENVAWFDIYKKAFYTIDKEMFEKAKIAFGLEDAPKPVITPAAPVKAMA